MNKFLKISLWIIGGLSSIILTLYLLLIVINWSDEPPSSAYFEMANRIANRPIAPESENGFIYMMGICAPQGESPVKVGTERINKTNVFLAKPGRTIPGDLWQEDCSEIDAYTKTLANIRTACISVNTPCVDTLFKNEQEIEAWLVSHNWLLERYKGLLSYPKWTTTVTFDFRMPFFHYSAIRNFQDMLLLKAWTLSGQKKTAEVKQLLELDIHFWRNLMASADILLDRAVAINLIRRHFTFGNLILRRIGGNKALLAIPESWKAPIVGSEISIRNVATGEFAFSASILSPYDTTEHNKVLDGDYFDPFFEQSFQPQATLNETATILLRIEKLFSVQHDDFPEALKKSDELQSELGMYHWYNMSGRLLLPMTVSTHSSLTRNAYNLEGKRRAALLTATLRANGVSIDHIVESLARSDIRDPYSNKPFTWDADSKSITYRGLQETDTSKIDYLY